MILREKLTALFAAAVFSTVLVGVMYYAVAQPCAASDHPVLVGNMLIGGCH